MSVPNRASNQPSDELIETLRNIKTEIGAGMVLFPRTDLEYVHNNACDRAISIITNYEQGKGLFQLTRELQSINDTLDKI